MRHLRLLFAVAVVGGCSHARPPAVVVIPGAPARPYTALPWYLSPALPQMPRLAGVWDDRVPVAGPAWRPTRDLLDAIRLHLARVDTVAIELRGMPDERGPERHDVAGRAAGDDAALAAELRRDAQAVMALVSARPDITAEAQELAEAAHRLPSLHGITREKLLNRIEALTDLIRLQMDATS